MDSGAGPDHNWKGQGRKAPPSTRVRNEIELQKVYCRQPDRLVAACPPGPGGKTAFGDVAFFDQFALKRSKALVLGLGPGFVFPTATDDRLGQGKWQIGPAMGLMSSKVTNWQLGAVIQNMVSFAGDEDRAGVNTLSIQPLVNYVRGRWYFGAGDFSWEFDWKDGGAMTIPLAFQIGYVRKIGKLHYNFSVEPVVWVKHSGQSPRWGIRFGFVVMVPEG